MEEKKKKKELKKVPRDIIPLGEDNWILQPIAISMMRYDYDTMQARTIVTMMKKMQAAIKEVVYRHAKPEDQLSLFANQEFISEFGNEEIDPQKEIVLKFPLNSFGCDKRRYHVLKESLKQLVSVAVEIPVRSIDDDSSYTKLTHLCEAYIPEERYAKDIYIKLEKSIALRFISVDSGTHQYLDSVIYRAKSKFTQRIYLLISAWKNHGATCERTVSWIRKWLRLEDSHKRWDMFYARVLKKAEDELREMAENGESDIYFTIKKNYNQPGKQGEPDSLQFIIHRATADDAPDSDELKKRKEEIGTFCNERFGIRGTDLKNVMEAVTEENALDMVNYIKELNEREQKALKSGKIDALHRHAYTCIMNQVKDWDEIRKQQMNILTSKPTVQEEQEKESHGCKCESLTAEETKIWEDIIAAVRARISEDQFMIWFSGNTVRYMGVNDGVLRIGVPTRAFLDTFVAVNGDVLQKAIVETIGENASFCYVAYQ